ncbi:MAG: cytochrome c-type biogenesis protein CcmH/NrfG [Myxococcota bacterium]|jgi:cytochrome c-type biogenesis protein CcmH/NrfG
MDWETWGLPLMILSVGLSAGIFLATRTGNADTDQRPEEDHNARKTALMEQIRELDADREKMPPGDYAARRETLISAAAATQRALEQPDAVAPAPSRPPSLARNGGWIVVTLLFFVILGVLINQYAAPRTEGGSMTGNGSGEGMEEIAVARQARQDAAQDTLREEPENIEALNILTYDALLYRDLNGAMEYSGRARELAPTDPGVVINLAILQMSVSMITEAMAALDTVIAADPSNGRALLWKGFMLANTDQKEPAIATLKQAAPLVKWPEEQLFTENMLRELTAPPPTVRVTGAATMAEGEETPAGTLYIYARRSEVGGGPPVAAYKHRGGLPVDFSLTDADMVMGGAWPDEVWVQARIDGDGDPMTRDDTLAQSAVLGPLSTGVEGLTLTLSLLDAAPAEVAPTEASPTEVTPTDAVGPRIAGTLSSTGSGSSGIVFVIVRRAGATGGPPVAAKRIEVTGFPLDFTITDGDMMLGGPWPDEVTISARLDMDGNAMTRSEGDQESLTVGPLSSGAADITLTLGEGGVLSE